MESSGNDHCPWIKKYRGDASSQMIYERQRSQPEIVVTIMPKAFPARRTLLEIVAIKRSIVKVASYIIRSSVNAPRSMRRKQGACMSAREKERERGWNKVARRDARVGVHRRFISCASDVTTRYKGDSKSEQMAFIVDHRLHRQSPST